MDRANFELARYLAGRQSAAVHLVAHQVSGLLRALPRIVVHQVSRPGGRHFLGGALLNRIGRRVARDLSPLRPIVVGNGGNVRWPGVNWVHYVFAKCPCQNAGAPRLFRWKNTFNRFRGLRKESASFRIGRLFIANSDKTRRDLIDAYNLPPERICTVYLGTDPDQFKPILVAERESVREELKIADCDRVILFVGVLGFDRNKGFDTLLDAFKIVAASGSPRYHLLAVGGGRLDYWQKLVNETGICDRVRLLGNRPDVPRLLAAADLFVSPSRYDSYGLAVHEAICRGVPAIVSKGAGVSERYTEELSDLVLPDPNDSIDLARRIDLVFSQPSRFQSHVGALGEKLRGWSWNDMAAEMVRLIEADSQ